VVVVGGSAGSLKPLQELAAALPADLPGPVLVTIHVGEGRRTGFPSILARAGTLPVAHATAGERLRPGRIYVAPPGHHLLVPGGVAELSNGPRVNYSRPAADVMFASAARWFGARVMAVVLSGLMDDGARGATLVARAGGAVVVQEPGEAEHPSMPRSALVAAPGAIAVPGKKLGETVSEMLGEPGTVAAPYRGPRRAAGTCLEEASDLQFLSPGEARQPRPACPECGGALIEGVLPWKVYYRCHRGHQFGPQSLAAGPAESPEARLWRAVAALERTAALARLRARHTDAGEDDAGRERQTGDRVTRLAESVRPEMWQTPER
jgi:two-component system chemotaxis response regulator CheB